MSKYHRTRTVAWPTVFVAAFLVGCSGNSLNETTPAHQDHAAAEWSSAAKSGDVPSGKSRVYLFLGHWHFPEAQWFRETENYTVADVYVNYINVGGLNPGECLVVDLPPGVYSFSWLERSRHPYTTVSLKETLGVGEAHSLSIETDQHLNNAPPSAVVGYFAEHEDLATVQPLTIVLPDSEAVIQSIAAVR